MRIASIFVPVVLLALVSGLSAQEPAFEIASIRPNLLVIDSVERPSEN